MKQDLFGDIEPIYRMFLPKIEKLADKDGYEVYEWDLPYTIRELAYLVHSHYRYYGKFPSTVAGQILEEVKQPNKNDYVLDNFCGSGTTLVEAKLRGIPSTGLDISWLSCLASNVKCRHVDISKIKKTLNQIIVEFKKLCDTIDAPEEPICKKWFEVDTAADLNTLRTILLSIENSPEKDFLVVAFIAIIRRVSKAFDGEVRPHINKEKRQREVISAFSKKVNDMCGDHEDYMALTKSDVLSQCHVGNNIDPLETSKDGDCYLAISHPPYLNSFNYTPVFNLEFYWGMPFEKSYVGANSKLYKDEMTAHPASEKVVASYFDHLHKCYSRVFEIQKPGAHLAIVIGDCTRKGEIIPVIEKTKDIVEKIGYRLKSINYRTTHYGLGKYAYKTRADYHGKAQKKDGTLIFVK